NVPFIVPLILQKPLFVRSPRYGFRDLALVRAARFRFVFACILFHSLPLACCAHPATAPSRTRVGWSRFALLRLSFCLRRAYGSCFLRLRLQLRLWLRRPQFVSQIGKRRKVVLLNVG